MLCRPFIWGLPSVFFHTTHELCARIPTSFCSHSFSLFHPCPQSSEPPQCWCQCFWALLLFRYPFCPGTECAILPGCRDVRVMARPTYAQPRRPKSHPAGGRLSGCTVLGADLYRQLGLPRNLAVMHRLPSCAPPPAFPLLIPLRPGAPLPPPRALRLDPSPKPTPPLTFTLTT